jgi:ubiquinone/menaquinone biosynthesis C-methylase UbiE
LKKILKRLLDIPEDASLRRHAPDALAKRGFLGLPADVIIASATNLRSRILEALMRSPLPIFLPYNADADSYILLKSTAHDGGSEAGRDNGLPIPPRDLWEGYGESAELFLNSGKVDVDTMRRLLESSGFRIQSGGRVLDLGCAAGRMIRWLADVADQCDVWGVDISAQHIRWCQDHLSPPFRFATVTTAPHLPFEDGYFDLIYCGSVFTHIDDLAEAWLLELKRIVRSKGRLYITVHDKHSADLIINHPNRVYSDGLPPDPWFRDQLMLYDSKEKFMEKDFSVFAICRPGPDSQVFYDITYLRQRWGRYMNVLSVTPEAYGYQTAIVLEK